MVTQLGMSWESSEQDPDLSSFKIIFSYEVE